MASSASRRIVARFFEPFGRDTPRRSEKSLLFQRVLGMATNRIRYSASILEGQDGARDYREKRSGFRISRQAHANGTFWRSVSLRSMGVCIGYGLLAEETCRLLCRCQLVPPFASPRVPNCAGAKLRSALNALRTDTVGGLNYDQQLL